MISPASTTGFFTLKLASKSLHFSSTFCQANFKLDSLKSAIIGVEMEVRINDKNN
jgi:hypothetical protein